MTTADSLETTHPADTNRCNIFLSPRIAATLTGQETAVDGRRKQHDNVFIVYMGIVQNGERVVATDNDMSHVWTTDKV